MARIALGVQYDGSGYCGWQIQSNQATVQHTLENAIQQFIGNGLAVRVTAAGRTDTGVHALGQVVHFDADVVRDDWSWVRGINAFLPNDVVVNWAKIVSSDFDARFSAYERTYIYALFVGPMRSPTVGKRAGHYMLPSTQWLDITAMQSAIPYLLGEHDFSSFRASECQSKTPIKHLYECNISSDQPFVYLRVRANAFLHHMVRNLMGSLLMVGLGKQEPEWIKTVLQAKSRELAAPTFAPDGLYLIKAAYPDEFQIPGPHWQNSWLPKELMLSV